MGETISISIMKLKLLFINSLLAFCVEPVTLNDENACSLVKADLVHFLSVLPVESREILSFLDEKDCERFKIASRNAYIRTRDYNDEKILSDFAQSEALSMPQSWLEEFESQIPRAFLHELKLAHGIAQRETALFDRLKAGGFDLPVSAKFDNSDYIAPRIGLQLSLRAAECMQRFLLIFGGDLHFHSQHLLPIFKTLVYGNIPPASRLLRMDLLDISLGAPDSLDYIRGDPKEILLVIHTYQTGPTYPGNIIGVDIDDEQLKSFNQCASEKLLISNDGNFKRHCIAARNHVKKLADAIRLNDRFVFPASVAFGLSLALYIAITFDQHLPNSYKYVISDPMPTSYYMELGANLAYAEQFRDIGIQRVEGAMAYHQRMNALKLFSGASAILAVIFEAKRRLEIFMRRRAVNAYFAR